MGQEHAAILIFQALVRSCWLQRQQSSALSLNIIAEVVEWVKLETAQQKHLESAAEVLTPWLEALVPN